MLREHAHVRGRAEPGYSVVFVPLLVQMDEGVGDVLGNNLGVTSSVVAGWVGHGNVCDWVGGENGGGCTDELDLDVMGALTLNAVTDGFGVVRGSKV